jgi:hypothetical protein
MDSQGRHPRGARPAGRANRKPEAAEGNPSVLRASNWSQRDSNPRTSACHKRPAAHRRAQESFSPLQLTAPFDRSQSLSFDGVLWRVLAAGRSKGGRYVFSRKPLGTLETRETVAIPKREGEDTSILGLRPGMLSWRTSRSGFLIVRGQSATVRRVHAPYSKTPEREFLTGVDDADDRAIVGVTLPRSKPGTSTGR